MRVGCVGHSNVWLMQPCLLLWHHNLPITMCDAAGFTWISSAEDHESRPTVFTAEGNAEPTELRKLLRATKWRQSTQRRRWRSTYQMWGRLHSSSSVSTRASPQLSKCNEKKMHVDDTPVIRIQSYYLMPSSSGLGLSTHDALLCLNSLEHNRHFTLQRETNEKKRLVLHYHQ